MKRKVSEEGRDAIRHLRTELNNIQMTEAGKLRKDRITSKLFFTRDDTLMQLNFFSDALTLLKEFVMLFQSQAPLIHVLHEKQVSLLKQFLLSFVKPEYLIASGNREDDKEMILSIDVNKKSLHLSRGSLFIGKAGAMLKTKDADVQSSFREKVLQAYVKGAQSLQKKLPLRNAFLQAASGLNPALTPSDALERLLQLPSFLPGIFEGKVNDGEDMDSMEEAGQAADCAFDQEVRKYAALDLPVQADDQRIDEWWVALLEAQHFPHLSKVVKAVLSCFHGPVVESSFNLMGDILDERSGRMNIETVDAIQTVKYAIKSYEKPALELFKRTNATREAVNPGLVKNMSTARKAYNERGPSKRGRRRQEHLTCSKANLWPPSARPWRP